MALTVRSERPKSPLGGMLVKPTSAMNREKRASINQLLSRLDLDMMTPASRRMMRLIPTKSPYWSRVLASKRAMAPSTSGRCRVKPNKFARSRLAMYMGS